MTTKNAQVFLVVGWPFLLGLSNGLPQIVLSFQDYLIHRIKELSRGGAISDYKWNGGSNNFKGQVCHVESTQKLSGRIAMVLNLFPRRQIQQKAFESFM